MKALVNKLSLKITFPKDTISFEAHTTHTQGHSHEAIPRPDGARS